MNIIETQLPGVLILEPRVFQDDRGYFLETWNQARYAAVGIPERFVQDNLSKSAKGVLRGLHYQHPNGQGKLVSVAMGEVFDVAVDVRQGSPTLGRWHGVRLSSTNNRSMYIPPGFAHGFVVLSDEALFCYKCTEYYAPGCESSLRWNDPDLAIDWPISNPKLSSKDLEAPFLRAIPADRLPAFHALKIRIEPGHETRAIHTCSKEDAVIIHTKSNC
jgi:dTDP-4-dehydrorhamnose 3,5-epimerase